MRLFLSRLLIGAIVPMALILPLTALQLMQRTPLPVQRFREPTLVIYGILLLALVIAPRRRERLLGAVAWTRSVVGHPRFFAIAAPAMLALYVLSVVGRHLAFHTFSHDFGMLDDAITWQPETPLLYTQLLGRSFLSEHFSPILLALVPMRAVIPSPFVLLLAQAGALWAAGVVLRRVLLADGHSVAMANLVFVLWLHHPFVVSTLQYVAHMESFLPVLLFGALLAARSGRRVTCGVLLLGALLVKEDVGLYLAGAGVWVAVARRRWWLGAAIAVAGVAWTVLCLQVLIPHFAPAGEGFRFTERWSQWGEGLGVLGGWITHPVAVVDALLGTAPVRIFAALAFLPFFTRWGWLLFAAPWILNVTSANGQHAGLSIYYGIPIVAFATVAAVEGLRARGFDRLRRRPRLAAAVGVAVVVLNVAHFSFPPVARDRGELLRAMSNISPDTPVQTMSCLYPVLGADVDRQLIVDGATPLTAPWLALRTHSTTWPLSGAQAEAMLGRALSMGYEVVAEADGAVLLRQSGT